MRPYLCLLIAAPLVAHTVSLTYAEVLVGERQVDWTLRLPSWSYSSPATDEKLAPYILSHVGVSGLTGTVEDVSPWKDPEGHQFLQVHLRFRSNAPSTASRCDATYSATWFPPTKRCPASRPRDGSRNMSSKTEAPTP